MRPIRTAILSLIIVAVAACGSTASTASSQPTVAPTAPPTVSPAPASASPVPSATVSTEPSQAPEISLYEWKVVAATSLKAGKTTFTISNFGAVPHELLIFKSKLPLSAYPTDKAGDIVEDGPGITLLSDGENIDPTGSQVRTVDLAPGTYAFLCNIPGHFKAGMFAVVTVTK
jgi:uncharacterized cupredoxin-like copper-binding protein